MRCGGGSRWPERSWSLGGIGPEGSQSRGGGSWRRGGTGNLRFGQLRTLVGSFAHVANVLFRTIRVVAGGMPGPVADLVSWNGQLVKAVVSREGMLRILGLGSSRSAVGIKKGCLRCLKLSPHLIRPSSIERKTLAWNARTADHLYEHASIVTM